MNHIVKLPWILKFNYFVGTNEMGPNKRFLGQENKRPPCKRGIVTYAVSQDDPRCHHYLWYVVEKYGILIKTMNINWYYLFIVFDKFKWYSYTIYVIF